MRSAEIQLTTQTAGAPVPTSTTMGTNEEPFRDRGPISNLEAVNVLERSDFEIVGKMLWSSNATYLVNVVDDEFDLQGIYKPAKGERPLWDFPNGLYLREVAAYELAVDLGWDIVPPTVRCEGPMGVGSLQLFVPCDFDIHYFHILEDPINQLALQKVCLFDYVANSTDRKGGHCLLSNDGKVWAIDNGLTFHVDFKLRTVIWDWAGLKIPEDLFNDLQSFVERPVTDNLSSLLTGDEVAAMMQRARGLMQAGHFPRDDSGTRYPWPVI